MRHLPTRLRRLSTKLRILGPLLASLAVAAVAANASAFEIPAWAFDRGNVATFTEEYADDGPMVAFGGQSPVVVEYDIPIPTSGRYSLSLRYAAGSARPVELALDGRTVGPVCRTATGSWNTCLLYTSPSPRD